MERNGGIAASSWAEESRVDTRRYLGALRRGKFVIIAIVAAVTLVVLAVSLILPKQYAGNGDDRVATPKPGCSARRTRLRRNVSYRPSAR